MALEVLSGGSLTHSPPPSIPKGVEYLLKFEDYYICTDDDIKTFVVGNEQFQFAIDLLKASSDCYGDTVVGVGGFKLFEIILARPKTVKNLLIIDIDQRIIRLWEINKRALAASSTGVEFLNILIKFLEEDEVFKSSHKLFGEVFFSFMRKCSSILNQDSFLRLKELSIKTYSIDLAKKSEVVKLKDFLDINERRVDVLYLSNVVDCLPKETPYYWFDVSVSDLISKGSGSAYNKIFEVFFGAKLDLDFHVLTSGTILQKGVYCNRVTLFDPKNGKLRHPLDKATLPLDDNYVETIFRARMVKHTLILLYTVFCSKIIGVPILPQVLSAMIYPPLERLEIEQYDNAIWYEQMINIVKKYHLGECDKEKVFGFFESEFNYLIDAYEISQQKELGQPFFHFVIDEKFPGLADYDV